MNTTRQDAWSNDEDILLAETVLRYIREGKTQLEAFKNVAKQLSRTSAACGFRWNATIRKQYDHAIQLAKTFRKDNGESCASKNNQSNDHSENNPLEAAILLLKKLKQSDSDQNPSATHEESVKIQQLQKENKKLKEKLAKFDTAWEEMGKLWEWVKDQKL